MATATASLIPNLITLVLAVLVIAAQWKIFTKAGEKGWKCLIPIYNSYTQFKFTWKTSVFWVYLGITFVFGILYELGGDQSLALTGAAGLLAIPILIIAFMEEYYLCKSFGKGVGFFIGCVFLPFIFLPILGFGGAQYRGNAGKKEIYY